MPQVICNAVLLLLVFGLPSQSPAPERLFNEAVAAQQRGDDVVAIRLYRQLLETHPEATVVRGNLGATLAHLRRYDEAIEQYRLILSGDPGNRPIRLNLALAYEGKEEFERAAKELESLHKEGSDDPQVNILLGDCYLRLGRYSQALAVLEPMETSQGNDPDFAWLFGSALIQAGRPEEGVRWVDKVAEKTSNAEAYLLAGQTRLALTEYVLALQDADAAMRQDPALAGVLTLKGMALEQTGNYMGAESALRRALEVNPRDFDAHFYLGAILYFKRNTKEARTNLETALQLRPDSAQAHYELALVSRAEGDLPAALKGFENAANLNPEWLQPHIELSALYYQLRRPEDGDKQRKIVDRLTAEHRGSTPLPTP
jgi:tetratricopeptide (TPR) repeat protein